MKKKSRWINLRKTGKNETQGGNKMESIELEEKYIEMCYRRLVQEYLFFETK